MDPRVGAYTESMACSSRTTVATMAVSLTFALAFAGLTACGHFGIDLVPAGDDGLDGGANVDGGGSGDGSMSADGAADASADVRNPTPPVCQGPNCPGVYVSGDVGNDGNDGTSAKPVATIAKGIELAVKRNMPTDVYVAGKANGGKYGDPITITEGISLIGGYDCTQASCSWKYDPKTHATILVGADYQGIVVGEEISRATVIDGFVIFGKGTSPNIAPGGAAVTINGAATLRNCKIEGSQATSGVAGNIRSIGVAILGPATKDPSGPLLEKNEIRAAQGDEESVGVWMNVRIGAGTGATVAATIRDNPVIRAGAAPSSYGIFARRVAPGTLVEDNGIASGPSDEGGEAGSWGIAVAGSMAIRRNLINAGAAAGNLSGPSCAGDLFCAGIRSDGATLVIQSNVIRSPRAPLAAGVVLAAVEGPAGTVVLNGNTIDAVGANAESPAISAAVVLENHTQGEATVGSIKNNILGAGSNAIRYGIYESKVGKPVHATAVDNNDFFFTPRTDMTKDYAFHIWTGTSTNVPFAQIGTVTTPVPNANKAEDPKLDSTWHLQSGSPVIDKGTNDSDAPQRDLDDEARPKGVAIDMGADEKQ